MTTVLDAQVIVTNIEVQGFETTFESQVLNVTLGPNPSAYAPFVTDRDSKYIGMGGLSLLELGAQDAADSGRPFYVFGDYVIPLWTLPAALRELRVFGSLTQQALGAYIVDVSATRNLAIGGNFIGIATPIAHSGNGAIFGQGDGVNYGSGPNGLTILGESTFTDFAFQPIHILGAEDVVVEDGVDFSSCFGGCFFTGCSFYVGHIKVHDDALRIPSNQLFTAIQGESTDQNTYPPCHDFEIDGAELYNMPGCEAVLFHSGIRGRINVKARNVAEGGGVSAFNARDICDDIEADGLDITLVTPWNIAGLPTWVSGVGTLVLGQAHTVDGNGLAYAAGQTITLSGFNSSGPGTWNGNWIVQSVSGPMGPGQIVVLTMPGSSPGTIVPPSSSPTITNANAVGFPPVVSGGTSMGTATAVGFPPAVGSGIGTIAYQLGVPAQVCWSQGGGSGVVSPAEPIIAVGAFDGTGYVLTFGSSLPFTVQAGTATVTGSSSAQSFQTQTGSVVVTGSTTSTLNRMWDYDRKNLTTNSIRVRTFTDFGIITASGAAAYADAPIITNQRVHHSIFSYGNGIAQNKNWGALHFGWVNGLIEDHNLFIMPTGCGLNIINPCTEMSVFTGDVATNVQSSGGNSSGVQVLQRGVGSAGSIGRGTTDGAAHAAIINDVCPDLHLDAQTYRNLTSIPISGGKLAGFQTATAANGSTLFIMGNGAGSPPSSLGQVGDFALVYDQFDGLGSPFGCLWVYAPIGTTSAWRNASHVGFVLNATANIQIAGSRNILTYSRSLESVVDTQLRLALKSWGAVIDNTTA